MNILVRLSYECYRWYMWVRRFSCDVNLPSPLFPLPFPFPRIFPPQFPSQLPLLFPLPVRTKNLWSTPCLYVKLYIKVWINKVIAILISNTILSSMLLSAINNLWKWWCLHISNWCWVTCLLVLLTLCRHFVWHPNHYSIIKISLILVRKIVTQLLMYNINLSLGFHL